MCEALASEPPCVLEPWLPSDVVLPLSVDHTAVTPLLLAEVLPVVRPRWPLRDLSSEALTERSAESVTVKVGSS